MFIAIVVGYARHLPIPMVNGGLALGSRADGVRHGVHVRPGSIDHFNIPSGFWQLAFANASAAALIWILIQALAYRAVNVLWLVMAIDLAAMAYMWSPSGFQAPITWLLVAYFVAQSLLWVTDRMREVDHKTLYGGGLSVTPEGAVAMSAAEPLVCFRDLRVSMFAMTLGMAYMFAAMQLLM